MSPATTEPLIVYAVEFTCAPHHAHACHRAVRVGEFPDYEAARKGIADFRKGHGANGTAATEYLGFTVWTGARPDGLPGEMWIDLEV